MTCGSLSEVDEATEPDCTKQVRQLTGQPRQFVEKQESAESGEHERGHHDDERKMSLHHAERRRESTEQQSGDQEWKPEPERVHSKKRAALRHPATARRDHEN